MEKQRTFFSSMKESNGEDNNINYKKRNSFSPNRILNLHQAFGKRKTAASIKGRHASAIELKSPNSISNHSFSKNHKYIHNKVKQYELHPFRRPNLKIVGEDIKFRIFEMNEEDNAEELEENFTKKDSFTKEQNHYMKDVDIIHNKELITKSNNTESKKEENEINKLNYKDIGEFNGTKVEIQIPKKKKRKKKNTNTKIEKDLASKLIFKYRKISRIKNLYDSNDDDETEEENKEDEYIINPESKIIFIFDFLILVFFFYNFNVSTINLCKEKCFCSHNEKITLSDMFLYFNDILCIIDLIISFFRAYYNFEYKLIKSNRLILIHFLKYDFIFDLLSAIPIFSISKQICLKDNKFTQCYKYEMPGILIFLQICSVLKALKIKKIIDHKKNGALEKFFELISDNYTFEKFINIILYALIYIGVLHCIISIHIFLGNHSYSNWLILTEAENEPFSAKYIKSFYFIITTLTTIGYGDIVCQSMIERVFQIIILAMGSIVYPLVVSTIGNLIRKDSNAKIKQNNNLSMLEKIRKDYPNISFKLYNSIYKYIESKHHSFKKYDVNSFIESLPFSLKNNILFTMYNNSIAHFKFFKKNNNSVFIAEVLNNFIPCVSKKNEFLIYEGEMVEEIIFIKDGKISLNAAINTENPTTSINKYFFDNFSPFSSEEEKKLISENMNNKSYMSIIGEMTYDKAKNKLNHAFKTFKHEKNIEEEKLHFQLNGDFEKKNDDYFDIKGGAIINDEGNYQYLKIVDIRKNEHFGCVFMTLKKPCPLSLQVKSKIAELFLLKKEQAVNLSKSYPNIWRKLYGKEFHNLKSIKRHTFRILKKYVEVNELFINNNLEDIMKTNDLTIVDLNILEKSILGEITARKSYNHRSSSPLHPHNDKESNNNEYDNKNKKMNLDTLKSNLQTKIKKFGKVRRNSTFSGNKNQLLPIRTFGNLASNNESSQKNNNLPNPFLKFNNKSDLENEKSTTFNNNTSIINNNNIILNNEKNDIFIIKSKEEKLKKLINFLKNSKKYFITNNIIKDIYSNMPNINEKKELQIPKLSSKKNCFKKKLLNDDNNSNNNAINKKKVEFNLNSTKDVIHNKFPNNEQILNDLKDICEEETNFSFYPMKYYKFQNISIEQNSNLEILSSYSNLNKISKGHYIKDTNFQKKIKLIVKQNYLTKQKESDFNESLSLHSIAFSSGIDSDKNEKKIKNKQNLNFTQESPSNKKMNEYKKKFDKNNSFNIPNKFHRMKNRKKITEKIKNKTSINNKKNLVSKKIMDETIKTNNKNKNNVDLFATFKINNQNFLEEQSSEIIGSSSIKANKSKTSSLSKKSLINKINNSYIHNNKSDINIYNNREIEFIMDKGNNKKINKNNLNIKRHSYFNNNHKIYKNR